MTGATFVAVVVGLVVLAVSFGLVYWASKDYFQDDLHTRTRMSSSQSNLADRLNSRPASPSLLIGRNLVPHISFFSFLKNALAGGCRAPKFPTAAPFWRRSFGILSSPDRGGLPSTCDALPDECSLLC